MKSKNKITLLNIASTIVLQGLAFFSGPLFSSVLGASNYGIAAVYLTWVQIASITFSLQSGGGVAVARIDFPKEEQEKYQSSALSLATFSFICFSACVLSFVSLTSKQFGFNIAMFALGLTQAWGMYCVTFMNAKFVYEFKADKNFILSVSASALTIGVSLLLIHFWKTEDNYWGRIIGQSVVYTVIGIILTGYMLSAGRVTYNKVYWGFTLPITVPTIFHSLAHIVLNQSDKVMIQGMISNSAAGIYALASTFSAVMNAIWHAFNNSWVPFYYEYTRQNKTDEMLKHARNYTELFTILTMGFILLSREVFHLYAGTKEFWLGTDYIPLLAMGYYFVFLYSFAVNFEFYNKKTRVIAVGTISAAFINVVLNYLLIKWKGALGAVIATAVSHFILCSFHYISSRHVKEMEFPFRLSGFIPGILAVAASGVIYWTARDYWMLRWGIGFVLGVYLLIRIIKRKEIF